MALPRIGRTNSPQMIASLYFARKRRRHRALLQALNHSLRRLKAGGAMSVKLTVTP
jgi:hypothetical protein